MQCARSVDAAEASEVVLEWFRHVGARDPLERAVAIVSLVRGILWAQMSIVMYNIHVGEYVSHLGHAQ